MPKEWNLGCPKHKLSIGAETQARNWATAVWKAGNEHGEPDAQTRGPDAKEQRMLDIRLRRLPASRPAPIHSVLPAHAQSIL